MRTIILLAGILAGILAGTTSRHAEERRRAQALRREPAGVARPRSGTPAGGG